MRPFPRALPILSLQLMVALVLAFAHAAHAETVAHVSSPDGTLKVELDIQAVQGETLPET